MFNKLIKMITEKDETRDYEQYIRNEYRSEWKNYRSHLHNPLVSKNKAIKEFMNSLD